MLLKIVIAALTELWVPLIYAAPSQPVDLKSLLSQRSNNWAKSTVVSFPDSSTFENATERWSTYDAPTYHAAVSPKTEEDVAKIVRHENSRTEGSQF